jgi:chromosome segregation ATPase
MKKVREGRKLAAVSIAMTAALTLLVLSPAVASGSPFTTGSRLTSPTVATVQVARDTRRALLQERIEQALGRRKASFDATAARLEDRIADLETLAQEIESAGGDVSDARAILEEAPKALERARELETQAAAQFRDVPDSENKKAAFVEARQTARQAVAELSRCRTALRQTAVELSSIVRDLYAGAGDE